MDFSYIEITVLLKCLKWGFSKRSNSILKCVIGRHTFFEQTRAITLLDKYSGYLVDPINIIEIVHQRHEPIFSN